MTDQEIIQIIKVSPTIDDAIELLLDGNTYANHKVAATIIRSVCRQYNILKF